MQRDEAARRELSLGNASWFLRRVLLLRRAGEAEALAKLALGLRARGIG